MINLFTVVLPVNIKEILNAFDKTLYDYEIVLKNRDIIPSEEGIPKIVKSYIIAKNIANAKLITLRQYTNELMKFFDLVKKSYVNVNANDNVKRVH